MTSLKKTTVIFLFSIFSIQRTWAEPQLTKPKTTKTKEQYQVYPWQKSALSLYQVKQQRFLIDGSGLFESGSLKSSAAQDSDKIENAGGTLSAEYGMTDLFALRIQFGYISGTEKNSTSSTKLEGVQDASAAVKFCYPVNEFHIFAELGAETSLEALKVDNVAKTRTAASGGTKAVGKLGVSLGHENYVFGGWAKYKYFLNREMELTSSIGTENLTVDGGHQLGLGGFFEYGTGLRTGVDIDWSLHNKATINSVNIPSLSDFELDYQFVNLGAYLKIPAGEKLLTYIKGSYGFNPNKKRATQSYEQDDLFQGQVGVQAYF
ncbi:MAG: hypothetical protein KDD45_04640 [Bdellovibrionales bacterium]|nr:hypothetical protein [Bdellovibrionales bacterium]